LVSRDLGASPEPSGLPPKLDVEQAWSLSTGFIYLRNRPVRTAYLVDTDHFHRGSAALRNVFDGNLGQRVECAGCGHSHTLPPDPEWSYRLNSLARRAIGTGTLMVLQALRELTTQASYSFYFSPSLDVFSGTRGHPADELDLICLCDGNLVLCECKSGRLKQAELDQFLARVTGPRVDALQSVSQVEDLLT
jgi:hypothetical protein